MIQSALLGISNKVVSSLHPCFVSALSTISLLLIDSTTHIFVDQYNIHILSAAVVLLFQHPVGYYVSAIDDASLQFGISMSVTIFHTCNVGSTPHFEPDQTILQLLVRSCSFPMKDNPLLMLLIKTITLH